MLNAGKPSGARDGGQPAVGSDAPDMAAVGNVHVAGRVQGNPAWVAEGAGCGETIRGADAGSGPGEIRDDAAGGDFANAVVVLVGKIDVALGVHSQGKREVYHGL